MTEIEINESIDILALLREAHRGWWEWEMWLRMHDEWIENAMPARHSAFGIEERAANECKHAELEKDSQFQALIDEIICKERGENGRALTREEAWSIAWDRMH